MVVRGKITVNSIVRIKDRRISISQIINKRIYLNTKGREEFKCILTLILLLLCNQWACMMHKSIHIHPIGQCQINHHKHYQFHHHLIMEMPNRTQWPQTKTTLEITSIINIMLWMQIITKTTPIMDSTINQMRQNSIQWWIMNNLIICLIFNHKSSLSTNFSHSVTITKI